MTITSFSGVNGGTVTIDGMKAQVENASRSYSLTEPDSNTLRFEVHSGDYWPNDVRNGNTSERSEIDMFQSYKANTQINVSYGLTLEPGAPNTAAWMLLGQIHQTLGSGSPPFAIGMYGERMVVIARGPNNAENRVYFDANPIQRDHQYQLNVQVNFGSNGTGTLKVWRDGVQIVNYSGALGTGLSGESYYWKEGIYRAPAKEVVAAEFSNLQITTGAAAAPTAPTQQPTPNVAPTVTLVSALPGTGVEHVGDTITMTVRFSEAVTVSGQPALSLNDGGKATYVSGTGSNTLTFKTTVAATDRDTSALAITGVNLNGGSIKDAGGLAANLSGAVKTFTGLQVDVDPISPTNPTSPTSPTNPTNPTSPSAVTPVLTVADPTLTVKGRGGTVDLGVKVSTTDSNDKVTVNIRGLASYETITDGLGHTFSGRNITLTKEQVDSGLTLHNYHRGWDDPVDTITLTATAKDPVTGAVTTSATQTMTLSDAPRGWTTTATTTPQTPTVQTPTVMAPSTSTPVTSTVTAPQPISVTNAPPGITTAPATTTTAASSTSPGSALLSRIGDFAAGGVATSAAQMFNVADLSPATSSSPAASLANQSFALLNQYMAASPGRVDPGQIVSAISNGTTWGPESFLTRPPAA
ncbi:heparin lyase I family protein [Bradyrhizobium sp. JYMT SZCCT0180]|uniref:heparin lyase I family protein n=1 Tax=Bradyrhizobium sp. JYMT SZCCT0180 TaxID=2807666 RepID=UPI001BA8AEE5|nr:heparin lyase I family protein [Bradyrhizobium sp. JYMT SZCCT0180]MBR1213942.1 heparin lyase I family protein [Bradyrhizobium sp. JYMT SZCCT0180]